MKFPKTYKDKSDADRRPALQSGCGDENPQAAGMRMQNGSPAEFTGEFWIIQAKLFKGLTAALEQGLIRGEWEMFYLPGGIQGAYSGPS